MSNLSGSCTGAGQLRWYNNSTTTGAGLSMPVTVNSSNTTFYAKCYDASFPAGCQYSNAVPLALSVTSRVTVTVSGPTTVCVNSTVNYTSSHSPGSWFIASGSSSATINSVTGNFISNSTPGSVTIGYAHTNGPCMDTGYLSITVIPPPVVSLNDTAACFGNTIQLTPSVGGGTYTVLSGPGNVTPAGLFSSASVGTTRVAYAITSGGCIGNDTADVVINPLPSQPIGVTTSDDTICRGATAILSGNCSGSTIVWYSNNSGTGTPLFSGNNYPANPSQDDTIYAFCYDSTTMCQSFFSDSISIVVEKCTDTITKLMPSNGCGDTTILPISSIPGGPNYINTCIGNPYTAGGDSVIFINDSTFYVIPSSLPYTPDSVCIVICNTTIPLCDTTFMRFMPNPGTPPISPPIITCMDDTVYIGTTGSVTVSPSQVSSVNYECLLPGTTAVSQSNFTCADTGVNTIWVYASNNLGAIDSCQANITVWDTTRPTVVCQNINAYLDATGNISITAADLDGGTNDNCAILNLTANPTAFTCADIGPNNVTLIATDVNGNIDSCTAVVTVLDTLPGSIVCNPGTFYITPLGTVTIDTTGLVSSVSDNCGIDSVWVKDTDTLLSCLNVGSYNATIYVSDVNGNIDSCISNLTVVDTNAPVANCMDTTIYLDSNGNVTIDSSFVNAGSNATCSNVTMALSQYNFGCTDLNINTVTLTVTDAFNRSSSCTANVTVLDTNAPVIICPSNSSIDVTEQCEYVIPDYTASMSITDNCAASTGITITQTPSAGTVVNATTGGTLQYTQPIIITATDPSNNQTTCTFNVDLNCNIDFLIPQFISPNNDGFNDTWIIDFITEYPNSSVKIFNRWGGLVYQMDNYDNSWDGTSNKGQKVNTSDSQDGIIPSATYFYIVDKGNGDDPYTGYLYIRK